MFLLFSLQVVHCKLILLSYEVLFAGVSRSRLRKLGFFEAEFRMDGWGKRIGMWNALSTLLVELHGLWSTEQRGRGDWVGESQL